MAAATAEAASAGGADVFFFFFFFFSPFFFLGSAAVIVLAGVELMAALAFLAASRLGRGAFDICVVGSLEDWKSRRLEV